MTGDDELKSAQRLRDEATELRRQAAVDLEKATYERGQAEHRLRTAEDHNRAAAERVRWLEQHDEADLVARERAVADREAAAQARDAEWDQAKFEALRVMAVPSP